MREISEVCLNEENLKQTFFVHALNFVWNASRKTCIFIVILRLKWLEAKLLPVAAPHCQTSSCRCVQRKDGFDFPFEQQRAAETPYSQSWSAPIADPHGGRNCMKTAASCLTKCGVKCVYQDVAAFHLEFIFIFSTFVCFFLLSLSW